jgi:hypothetical protein
VENQLPERKFERKLGKRNGSFETNLYSSKMTRKSIHIISLDVPFPPDYGGVIDIYYRAKALKDLGIYVILHCFEYGRGTNHDFKEIADEIHYYKRKKSLWSNFKKEPFIVATRRDEKLVNRLLEDNFPILMEGLHTTSILSDERFANRQKWVRIHNVEWQYYEALAYATSSPLKYEKILAKADQLFCLNERDLDYYLVINSSTNLWAVGCDFKVNETEKPKNYALFHGNLSVSENERALRWIIESWDSSQIQMPLIVAGKNPSKGLQNELKRHSFISLKSNPSSEEMDELIRTAEINLLITFQSTGVKLKLINSIIQGNRCVVNPLMIEGTDLGQFCEIIDDAEDLIQAISIKKILSSEEKTHRIDYLKMHFEAVSQARKVLGKIGFEI